MWYKFSILIVARWIRNHKILSIVPMYMIFNLNNKSEVIKNQPHTQKIKLHFHTIHVYNGCVPILLSNIKRFFNLIDQITLNYIFDSVQNNQIFNKNLYNREILRTNASNKKFHFSKDYHWEGY